MRGRLERDWGKKGAKIWRGREKGRRLDRAVSWMKRERDWREEESQGCRETGGMRDLGLQGEEWEGGKNKEKQVKRRASKRNEEKGDNDSQVCSK